MKHRFVALTAILALATASANAADLSQPALPTPVMPTGSTVPNSAFFLGLGASANWTNFGHQHVYAIGTSNVFTDGVLSASGSAQGPTNIHMDGQVRLRAIVPGRLLPAFRRERLAMGSETLVQLSGSDFDQL